ncbi:MAG: sigma-70 family RNA polymerase sigma factor [Blastocatellales bacterium]
MNAVDFEEITLPHSKDLYRAATRLVGNSSDAEDVLQETYLQAWRSIERFQEGTNIRAWLYKILFHVVSHHRRKCWKFTQPWSVDDEPCWEETLVYTEPVAQQLTDEDVLAAFDRVPSIFAEAVLLADVEEFSYAEIASILNIPIGTVMSRLYRGRKMLAKELEGYARSIRVAARESLSAAA